MRFPNSVPMLAVAATALSIGLVGALDFETDIQPILKDHCFKCHSGPKAKAKLRYDNARYFAERIGTHADAVVVPGNPDRSKLVKLASLPRTDTDAMPPPRRGEPLNSAELALVRRWIEEGASLEKQAPSPPETGTPSPDRNQVHEWTNVDNKTLRATFVSLSGSSVRLRKEDGSEFSYPLSKLSEESQKLAQTLGK